MGTAVAVYAAVVATVSVAWQFVAWRHDRRERLFVEFGIVYYPDRGWMEAVMEQDLEAVGLPPEWTAEVVVANQSSVAAWADTTLWLMRDGFAADEGFAVTFDESSPSGTRKFEPGEKAAHVLKPGLDLGWGDRMYATAETTHGRTFKSGTLSIGKSGGGLQLFAVPLPEELLAREPALDRLFSMTRWHDERE